MHQVNDTESGEIVLDVKTVKLIAKALREWTNTIHAAVMFEIKVIADGVPSTKTGLTTARQRIQAGRDKWAVDDAPLQRRLINMLALTALDQHADECAAGTGKWKSPTARTLDDLLPSRTSKDTYFRVPDAYGSVPAAVTLDYDSLVWHAESTNGRSAASTRTAPLAALAFAHLARVTWRPGMGGTISSAKGVVVASYPST